MTEKQGDLFGPATDQLGRPLKKAPFKTGGIFGQKKVDMGYRLAGRHFPQRCGTCGHFQENHLSKTYRKCRVLGNTRSAASDINASYVCNNWTQKAGPAEPGPETKE